MVFNKADGLLRYTGSSTDTFIDSNRFFFYG